VLRCGLQKIASGGHMPSEI